MSVIFLPVESTARELDYKVNLARLFCKEGFDVVLGNPPFIRDELKYKNQNALFLEKGVNPDPGYYQGLSDKGVYLYDLGDEGAACPVYSINYQPAIDSLKLMRKIFLWGHEQKRDLINRNPDPVLSEKYQVMGGPAFDLCMPKYKEFHKKLKPKNIPNAYILVNTNFGCFQSYTMAEHLKACDLISPASIQMIEDSYQLEKKQFPHFKRWLEEIIQSFPSELFLIRPHPSEIASNYQKLFGHYKNVLISKAGNVNQIIASAKLVLHKDCSTAMQSYLMGVPAISLGGYALHREYVQWPLFFSALPDRLSEASAMIRNVLQCGAFNMDLQVFIRKKAESALSDYFHDMGNSSKNLVDCIVKDSRATVRERVVRNVIDTRPFVKKAKLFIRKNLPVHYKVPIASRETMIKITKKDILKRLGLLEAIDASNLQFKVKKLFPNAFRISVGRP